MADGDVVITARPENGTATPEPAAESPHPETRREDRVQKLNKRQRKMMRDAHRPLESWERYRALTDVIDEQMDLIDLADHKARFALIIMGALNLLLGERADKSLIRTGAEACTVEAIFASDNFSALNQRLEDSGVEPAEGTDSGLGLGGGRLVDGLVRARGSRSARRVVAGGRRAGRVR